MPDNDQRPGVESRGADGTDLRRGVRIGRTAVAGWALAAVLLLAGVGTAMGDPVAVAQPRPVADVAAAPTASARLDPLALLPTARPLSPAAVLPNLPTIASGPTTTTVTATATATPTATASVPAAQLRQTTFTADAPDARAAVAIRTALAQIGLPYVWGGNGPTNGDAGFDCSGLTTFSYANAGVPLPRTAHTQYNAGPHVPSGAALQPGDLVFYGTAARVHHVGMYLGAGRMVNAPTFGKPVQVAFYRYRGDDYLGATRPAASAGSLTSGILPFVDPAQIPAVPRTVPERVFTAPTAPLPAVLPQPGDATLPPEQVSAAQAIQEGDAVAVSTAVARSAAVAGATTSTSAPVTTAPTTAPAAVATVTTAPTTTSTTASTTSTATTGTTTTATAVPVTSAPATTAAPVTTTATSTAKATTATAPKTTAPKTTTSKATASTTTTAPAAAADDETSTTKAATKTTTAEKTAEKSEEPEEKKSDSESTSEKATSTSDDEDDGGSDSDSKSDGDAKSDSDSSGDSSSDSDSSDG